MTGRIARFTAIVWALSLAGVVAATSGCRTAAPLGGTPRHVTATLSVENNGFSDRVIYLVLMGGMRQRLGTARAASTTNFVIPEQFIMGSPQVRILADIIGGIQPEVSQRTYVAPGDTVMMVIDGSQ